MTTKKNSKKVREVLNEQELNKTTGGMDDYPLKEPNEQSGKMNPLLSIPLPL